MSLEHEWSSRRPVLARGPVLDGVLKFAGARPWEACVDLGAGDGAVTFALAPVVASVLTVAATSLTATTLAGQAREAGLRNVAVRAAELTGFDLPPGSADLVVSNFATHPLPAAEKRQLVARTLNWLRPGGRLIVAEVMFGRGQSRQDRRAVRHTLAAPPWWRIPRPRRAGGLESPAFWRSALRDAGFTDVGFEQIRAEAGVIRGVRPRRDLTFTGPLTRS